MAPRDHRPPRPQTGAAGRRPFQADRHRRYRHLADTCPPTDLADKLGTYGQVIVDECHHVPAAAFETAVRAIPARYWVGLTATPYRRDGLDDLIGFQLGPVRHTFTHADPGTLEGAGADRPRPVLVVHATSFRLEDPVDLSIPGAIAGVHRALAEDEARNGQILTDVVEALGRGRHCLVLAQRTGHVDHLATALAERGLDPVVLKGGMGAKQRAAAITRLNPSDSDSPLLVVATGHFVGEGFDCPALDTLFLAGPVSFKGRLVQYAGRILRADPGKQTAEVHDYHDVEVPVLAAALAKRAPGYLSLGFTDPRRLAERSARSRAALQMCNVLRKSRNLTGPLDVSGASTRRRSARVMHESDARSPENGVQRRSSLSRHDPPYPL